MTFIDAPVANAAVRVGLGIAATAARLAIWWRQRRMKQRHRVPLDELSNHLRRDIGLPPVDRTPIDLRFRPDHMR